MEELEGMDTEAESVVDSVLGRFQSTLVGKACHQECRVHEGEA